MQESACILADRQQELLSRLAILHQEEETIRRELVELTLANADQTDSQQYWASYRIQPEQ